MEKRSVNKIAVFSLSLLIFLSSKTLAATNDTNDMLTWMDCKLASDAYVGYDAERLTGGVWTSLTNGYQPFKTIVNRAWHQIYWRKDSIDADYYGELWTYDNQNIRLHTETFPAPTFLDPPSAPSWDQRIDRVRLFVEYGQSNWGLGRILAPVTITPGWSHAGYINAYICNSFADINNKTGGLYQSHFYDNSVTIESVSPFNIVYDGEAPGWPASSDFKNFDKAVMIVQIMQGNVGRERFIFGCKDGVFYGLVRWDNAVWQNNQWQITERAVGLNVQHKLGGFGYAGFYERARRDNGMISSPYSDVNVDGVVNFKDFSLFIKDWLLCNDNTNVACRAITKPISKLLAAFNPELESSGLNARVYTASFASKYMREVECAIMLHKGTGDKINLLGASFCYRTLHRIIQGVPKKGPLPSTHSFISIDSQGIQFSALYMIG